MKTRLAHLAGVLAAICLLHQAPAAHGGTPSIADRFLSEPPASLIRRLLPGTGWSTDDPDLVISQTHRWLAGPKLLVIESTLRNKGAAAKTADGVCVADWAFQIWKGPDGTRHQPLTYRKDTWYGSTYWAGPGWTRVGKDWHHPGNKTPSVRRYTAPRDGRVTISGRVYKAHLSGDGIRAFVRHNGRTVWQIEIGGTDAKGAEPKLALDVRKGDAIRFIVHKRGSISCDTTRWDPVVTYADGERHQASKEFSTSAQGENGWSYEMVLDAGAGPSVPRLRSLDLDLGLRTDTLAVGGNTVLQDTTCEPFIIIADHVDRSGIVLACDPAGPWRLSGAMTAKGLLKIKLNAAGPAKVEPGKPVRLPDIVLGVYRGRSSAGVARLMQVLMSDVSDPALEAARARTVAAMRRAAAPLDDDLKPDLDTAAKWAPPELDLWMMVLGEWRRDDKIRETAESYAAAAALHVKKGRRLLADLRRGKPEFLSAEAGQFERLAKLAERPNLTAGQRRMLYYRIRWMKRRIALANPLMKFGKLLFCKRAPTSYSHLVMQYFGWRARAGGGLFVLENPGQSLRIRDILGGRLSHGNVLEPRLSYDGKRIVFSFVNCGGPNPVVKTPADPSDKDFYHLYEVNADGTNLRQLTHGAFDDTMPAYLPDGGIVFCSTRRRGYARCFGGQFGPRWHVYTLHRCDKDGRNIRTLSFHDTNEWFPTVANDGRILYARWDYIDRDAVTHQNLWSSRPDGTNPVTVWGNATPKPHCSFQMKPIPRSRKILFVASAHHSITAGTLCILDPTVGVDGLEAITRITPEIRFPEAETRAIREYYTAPWPLSETYYLTAYSPMPLVWEPRANYRNALGIYLLDRFGNRELIYRDPEIGSTNPIPLVPRRRPPVLASHLPKDAPPEGEMVVTDVYRGLKGVRRGSVKALRIVQIFPKVTVLANRPSMGVAGEENGRAILGTVPVEADGSAHFTVPARKPILFQALDKDGFAIQTMRSATYLQPGEQVSCVGCHESRMTAPSQAAVSAQKRPPSKIDPGLLGGRPFSYAEIVQPVLDKHCVKCHSAGKPAAKINLTGTRSGPWTRSYRTLTRSAKLVPRYRARNRIEVTPVGGKYGALGSGLLKMLRKGHKKVQLSADELRRLAAWIDLNAIFYGTPEPDQTEKMRRGERVPMPKIQ